MQTKLLRAVVVRHQRVVSLMVALVFSTAFSLATAHAENLKSAEITKITNQVEIIPAGKAPEKASIGTVIQGNTGVKTGANSRTELTFPDKTLARLGANTLFSFESGTRTVELKNGILLLQVPKNAGGAKITTAPVTAAITGTTILVEFSSAQKSFRLTVIEGTVKLTSNTNSGQSVVLSPGKTVSFSNDTQTFSTPENADIGQLLKTSSTTKEGPLGNQQEINDVLAMQQALKDQGIILQVIDTDSANALDNNAVEFGGVGTEGQLAPSGLGTSSSGAGSPGNLGNQTSP
ncbi:MAG: FecR family protein [Chthoniobacterales bacterium]